MSEMTRELTYHPKTGDPCMILRPKRGRTMHGKKGVLIMLDEVWKYTKEKNPDFDNFIFRVGAHICNEFGLGEPTCSRIYGIHKIIEDGIEELVKMPPAEEVRRAYGEGKLTVGGKVMEFDLDKVEYRVQ